jgi:hypothetical protein
VGVGGLYLAGLLITGGEIDAGTTVRGVEIGGLSRAEAVRKLERHLNTAGSRELPVKVGERRGAVDPRRAGLSFDLRETVDRAARTGADPFSVFGGFFRSGGAIEPVVRLDEDKARAALGRLAKGLDQKVRDGAVSFDGGRVEEVAPRTGYALDVNTAIDPLRASFLRGDADAVTPLPARETRPKVTPDEVRRAVRTFAEPAVSAPVTLTAGGKRFTVGQDVLGEHLTMRPDGSGRLRPAPRTYAPPRTPGCGRTATRPWSPRMPGWAGSSPTRRWARRCCRCSRGRAPPAAARWPYAKPSLR